jgi:hypothetical protein
MTSGRPSQRARKRRSLLATALAMLAALSYATTATAAEAGWSFDPAIWDFGTIIPGTGPTPPKAFTLTNTGEVDLQPFFVGVGNSDGSGFDLAGNTCGTLAPGSHCEISVTFEPSSAGAKRGQLSVGSQGGLTPPASAELRGTGAGPIVSIAPSTGTFEPRDLDAGPSAPKTFSIANDGQLDLTISSISIRSNAIYNYPGAAAEQFDLAGGTCKVGVPVPPADSCTVDVTFSPTVQGALSAQLSIAGNAPEGPHVADLNGVGVALAGRLALPSGLLPSVSIFHHPPHRGVSRNALFWLRGSATATQLACKLDARPFRTCESPVRFRHLGVGAHRFAARALDEGGRWGLPREFRWRIVSSRRSR